MKRVLLSSLLCLGLAACASPGEDSSATSTGGAGGYGAGGSAPVTAVGDAMQGGIREQLAQVGDRVFFGTDRYDLSPEATATLDRQVQLLRSQPGVRITLEGHSDERGTREYNLALGDRRAAAARAYLVAQGIDASRITTLSYGKERPAVPGASESAWQQNRRAVTVIAE
ncbi:MAG TPA: peptidoglycan-associated lipoprotein Pal [Azospirillaceae bacterium]|nr:peptidoglycan-associated lipoprotein Pal [Azospirillaceae bacterium]